MVRATLVMEQHLGHLTYYRNLRSFVEPSAQIQSTWVLVTYEHQPKLWDRVAVLPAQMRGALRGREQVRAGLKHSDDDVFFFNTQIPAVLGGRLVRKRPYVISTDLTPIQYDQMSDQYNHRSDRSRLVKTYKHLMNVAVLRGAARLVPWSTWARASLIADYGVDPARVEVLPPGVDIARWAPRGDRVDGPLRILFVGGDLGRKGGDVLIEAFRALPRGAAELILVTRSPAPNEDGVRVYQDLQPNSPELIAQFQRADIFVLPTNAEAFGIAGAEASAAGLPAIVTTIGGMTDIVVDGETGFLIPPGNVQALIDRLILLKDDPCRRERMARAARLRAETYFDARRNAERLIACLHTAAVEGGQHA